MVNALSRKLVATIRRDGFEWQQTFKRGKPATELEKVGPFRGHGTTIYFEPDPDIFKTTQFDPHLISTHLEDMSYIHSGLKITFKNEVTKEMLDLTHPGGIPEFLERLVTEGQKPTVTEAPVQAGAAGRREDGGRPAVDRIDRRDDPLLRQRHPHRRPAAPTRAASRAASSRPSATSWPRTRSRPRA